MHNVALDAPDVAEPRRRVCLLTLGTTGDVQPMLAVAKGLQAKGAAVLLITHASFSRAAAAAGVDFRSLGPGVDDALRELPEGRAFASAKRGAAGALALEKFMRRVSSDAWTSAQAAMEWFKPHAALLSSVSVFVHASLCDLLQVPFAVAHFQPLVPTSAYAPPVMALPSWRFARLLNRATWALAVRGTWLFIFKKTINALRVEHGMPPIRGSTGCYGLYCGKKRTTLLLHSPLLSPRPRDFPAAAHITGAPHLPAPTHYAPPPELAAFLSAGAPPVAVTFGSMAAFLDRGEGVVYKRGAAQLLRLCAEAARGAGRRCVVFVDGAPGGCLDVSADVLPLTGSVPHAWLFPRCAAVVCHGGPGTVHACLLAGVPCLPVAVEKTCDQSFWGRCLVRAKLTPRAFQAQSVSRKELCAALRACLGDQVLQARLREVQQHEAGADAAARAAQLVLDLALM
jgi:UDP:flavonoid glycosyltransferase YjiC (YdhE family)